MLFNGPDNTIFWLSDGEQPMLNIYDYDKPSENLEQFEVSKDSALYEYFTKMDNSKSCAPKQKTTMMKLENKRVIVFALTEYN